MALIGTIAINVRANTEKLAVGLQTARGMLASVGKVGQMALVPLQASVTAASVAFKALGVTGRAALVGLSVAGRVAAGSMGLLLGAVRSVLAPLGGLVTVLGPLLLGAAVVKTGSDIETLNRRLRTVSAVAGGLADEEMQRLKSAAIEVGRVTKFTGVEAAEGLRFLVAAGLDADAAIKALPVTAKFAQAALLDLGDATDRLVIAVSAMGLDSQDATTQMESMTRVADVLAKGSTLAATTVTDISDALSVSAGSAKLAGLSVEETVAAIIALQKRGFRGAKAGETLRQMLDAIAKAAAEKRAQFEALGIAVVDSNDQFRGSAAVLADFQRAFAGKGFTETAKALSDLGIPVRAQKGFKALLEASGEIDTFTEALQNAGGAAEKMADDQLTPLEKGWANLKAAIESVAEPLFTPIFAALGENLGKAGDALRMFQGVWGDIWDVIVLSTAVQLDRIVSGAFALLETFQAVGGATLGLFEAVARDVAAVGMGMFEGLSSGLAAFVTRWQDLWGLLRTVAAASFQAIKEGLEAALDLEDPVEAARQAFVRSFDAESIADVIRGGNVISDAVREGFGRGIAEAGGATRSMAALESLGDALQNTFGETFDRVVDQDLSRRLGEAVERVSAGLEPLKKVTADLQEGPAAAAEAMAEAAETTKEAAQEMVAMRADAAGAVLEGSQEAFSALARRERGVDVTRKLEDNTKRTADNTAEMVRAINELQDEVGVRVTVNFP